jgi:hypothetical protein
MVVVVENSDTQSAAEEPQNGGMGRQSQHRNSQTKRVYQLAGNNNLYKKKQKQQEQVQQTLTGGEAFVAEKHCKVCRASRALSLILENARIPKRSHHVNCLKNTKTKGKGALSALAIARLEDDKRC